MSGSWDNEICLTLIDAYESKRVLWDSSYEEYYNRTKKEDAWREISEILNVSVNDVKNKIVSLTGSFRRERAKQKRSSTTGSGRDQVYVSKWFAFDRMKFLMDKSEPNETRDSCNEKRTQDMLDAESQNINDNEASSEMRPPIQKTVKRQKIDKDNPMLKSAFELLKKTADNDDPYTSYALNIANELKKYDKGTLACVKDAINNIIFQADMGNYSPNAYYTQQQYGYGASTSASAVSSPYVPPSPTFESTGQPSPAETSILNEESITPQNLYDI